MQEPDNLNPFIGIQGLDYMFWHMNYDFLVGFDSKDLEPRPELATSWEVSPDGREWTFTIRSDAKWQDGVPVTAGDVAFTFNYIVDNKLLNLSTYTNGITGAEVIDDTHVKITTDAPKANMLRMVVPILPEHIWSKISGKGGDVRQPEQARRSSTTARSSSWSGRRASSCASRPTRPTQQAKPKVDEVVFELYTNPDTMAQDLKLGTIDGAVDIPPAQFKRSAERRAHRRPVDIRELNRAGHDFFLMDLSAETGAPARQGLRRHARLTRDVRAVGGGRRRRRRRPPSRPARRRPPRSRSSIGGGSPSASAARSSCSWSCSCSRGVCSGGRED